MLAKMRAPQDGGSRLAIVFTGSPLFTGDAGGGESEIRRWIIESDWMEAIVALPEQLFCNTGISTYLWVLTNRKEKPLKAKMQLIDARPFWVQMEKSLGNKRRRIGEPSDKEKDPDHIGELTKIFSNFRDGQTRTFTEEDPVTHQPEPDADLRDTETVPLKESIEAYFEREVLPHVPDAWIDTTKTKVGYEIPLNRTPLAL